VKLFFPIKTRRVSERITQGIAIHKAGLPAEDPITGQLLSLVDPVAQELDPSLMWLFEYFSYDMWHRILEKGPLPALWATRRLLILGLLVFISSTFVSAYFYKNLGDPGLSLIPVLSIIACGSSMSFTLVSAARWKAARQLVKICAGRTESSRKVLQAMIESKGAPCPGEVSRMRQLALMRMARKFLIAVCWMTVFLGMVLMGYGVFLRVNLGEGYWYVGSAIAVGTLISGNALYGAISAYYRSRTALKVYFVLQYTIFCVMLVLATLIFLFKNEAKAYAMHNVQELLLSGAALLPKHFCPGNYARMNPFLQKQCSAKVGDKVFELMVVMGLIGWVVDIILGIALLAVINMLRMRFLFRPMLATTCVLSTLLALSVVGYAAYLADGWKEFMGEDIGGVTLGTGIAILIGISVTVLFISLYGMFANIRLSSWHLGAFSILEMFLVILVITVSGIVYRQVDVLNDHIFHNFDAGTRIRKDLARCFCNIDEVLSCGSLYCNELDLNGLPTHYYCQEVMYNGVNQYQCSHPKDARCMSTKECTERLGHNWTANLAGVAFLGLFTLIFLLANIFSSRSLRARILREEMGDFEEMEELNSHDQSRTEHDEAYEDELLQATSAEENDKRRIRRTNSGSYLPDLGSSNSSFPGSARKPPKYEPSIAAAIDIAAPLSVEHIEELMAQLQALRDAKIQQERGQSEPGTSPGAEPEELVAQKVLDGPDSDSDESDGDASQEEVAEASESTVPADQGEAPAPGHLFGEPDSPSGEEGEAGTAFPVEQKSDTGNPWG